MMVVRFLTIDEVLEIHASMIEQHGGSPELRDAGLLKSAVAMPQMGFGGEFAHPDVPSMAAAYLFHLAKNHPFVDGNKRVAAKAAHVFLLMNRMDFVSAFDDDALAFLTTGVAAGDVSKERLTDTFRDCTVIDGTCDA